MTYRKIGGLHWIAIGRLRIAWCWKHRIDYDALKRKYPLKTYTTNEYNRVML